MLQEEHSHLGKRIPFKCKHGVSKTLLVTHCSREFKVITFPGPRIAHFNVVKRIVIKHLQNEDMQSFHQGKITGVRLQDSRKQVKDELANLEKAEGVSAKIGIRTSMFGKHNQRTSSL